MRSDVSQIFSFFIGFLFQSIQVTFATFGLGVAAILVVRGLILKLAYGLLNEKFYKVGYPALVDVQQTPGHLAFAEGDEGKAAMSADEDVHSKREAIRHVMCWRLLEGRARPCCSVN